MAHRDRPGAYVGYDLDRNLADIAIESHRARCLVIGEDLGTVPEGFRDKIDANDVLSYRVMFFEREGLKFLPPGAYPEKAVACVATHDLPTLAGWWKGADFIERGALGKMSREDADRAAADRGAEKRWLVEAIEVDVSIDSPEVPRAVIDGVHRFVGETPSLLGRGPGRRPRRRDRRGQPAGHEPGAPELAAQARARRHRDLQGRDPAGAGPGSEAGRIVGCRLL